MQICSAALVNQKQLYVSVSRARGDAHVFTNDQEALAQTVTRDVRTSTALEAVRASGVEARADPDRPRCGEWRHERLNGRQAQPQRERGRNEPDRSLALGW